MSWHTRHPCPGSVTGHFCRCRSWNFANMFKLTSRIASALNNVAVAVGGVGTVVEEMPLAEACSMRPLACDVALSKTTTFFNEGTNPHIGPLPLAAAANRDVVVRVQQPCCSRALGLVRQAHAFISRDPHSLQNIHQELSPRGAARSRRSAS